MIAGAEQMDMFPAGSGYPETPGARRTDTSEDAAADVAKKAPVLRDRCLAAIVEAPHGLTADEVAAAVGQPVLTIRPRITELNKNGLIRDSGGRRRNLSGKRAIVWVNVWSMPS